MAATDVPVKTPEALAELGSRQRRLSQRHRTVLLLVDGRRSEAQVREMALQAGAAETCFDELVGLGMIDYVEAPALPVAQSVPTSRPVPLDAIPPISTLGPDSVASLLPASLSLHPESSLNDSVLNEPPASDMGELDLYTAAGQDQAFEEARELLVRAVRAEAPVAGSLTLLRLRRARTRPDLEDLLEEVELRITKPFKGLWASQTMSRVRELLATHSVS
ncbi:hypothetical protein [Rhizobacter sp. LjRoot28]|uniref:hypothetical protein n=1 Tax=Rhizobacter sp. LjRoot28 TaxID=3342309 RepID=UPI003ECFD485